MSELPPQPEARQFERLAAFLRLIPEGGALDRLLKGAAHLEDAPTTPAVLAADILRGADDIAFYLFGDKKHRRKVYRLIEAEEIPHFRLGRTVCSRKSVLIRWMVNQETLTRDHQLSVSSQPSRDVPKQNSD